MPLRVIDKGFSEKILQKYRIGRRVSFGLPILFLLRRTARFLGKVMRRIENRLNLHLQFFLRSRLAGTALAMDGKSDSTPAMAGADHHRQGRFVSAVSLPSSLMRLVPVVREAGMALHRGKDLFNPRTGESSGTALIAAFPGMGATGPRFFLRGMGENWNRTMTKTGWRGSRALGLVEEFSPASHRPLSGRAGNLTGTGKEHGSSTLRTAASINPKGSSVGQMKGIAVVPTGNTEAGVFRYRSHPDGPRFEDPVGEGNRGSGQPYFREQQRIGAAMEEIRKSAAETRTAMAEASSSPRWTAGNEVRDVPIDVGRIADEVYRTIERRILHERERRGH